MKRSTLPLLWGRYGRGRLYETPCWTRELLQRCDFVAGAVVGQDPTGGDLDVGEVCVGPWPESDGSLLLLVGQDLAVGEPRVIADGVVKEAHTCLRPEEISVRTSGSATSASASCAGS